MLLNSLQNGDENASWVYTVGFDLTDQSLPNFWLVQTALGFQNCKGSPNPIVLPSAPVSVPPPSFNLNNSLNHIGFFGKPKAYRKPINNFNAMELERKQDNDIDEKNADNHTGCACACACVVL